jgi:hypothetical protein
MFIFIKHFFFFFFVEDESRIFVFDKWVVLKHGNKPRKRKDHDETGFSIQ